MRIDKRGSIPEISAKSSRLSWLKSKCKNKDAPSQTLLAQVLLGRKRRKVGPQGLHIEGICYQDFDAQKYSVCDTPVWVVLGDYSKMVEVRLTM